MNNSERKFCERVIGYSKLRIEETFFMGLRSDPDKVKFNECLAELHASLPDSGDRDFEGVFKASINCLKAVSKLPPETVVGNELADTIRIGFEEAFISFARNTFEEIATLSAQSSAFEETKKRETVLMVEKAGLTGEIATLKARIETLSFEKEQMQRRIDSLEGQDALCRKFASESLDRGERLRLFDEWLLPMQCRDYVRFEQLPLYALCEYIGFLKGKYILDERAIEGLRNALKSAELRAVQPIRQQLSQLETSSAPTIEEVVEDDASGIPAVQSSPKIERGGPVTPLRDSKLKKQKELTAEAAAGGAESAAKEINLGDLPPKSKVLSKK